MTRDEFIEILKKKGYSYEIEGDKIVVTYEGTVDLRNLTSLPPGVEFKNGEGVSLYSLTSLPPSVEFNNGGDVALVSLDSLHTDVVFRNGGSVYLYSLTSLPSGLEFKNVGVVGLRDLIGGNFNNWEGNIEGIDNKRLLNSMISKGMLI
jgi:hypothetical protein